MRVGGRLGGWAGWVTWEARACVRAYARVRVGGRLGGWAGGVTWEAEGEGDDGQGNKPGRLFTPGHGSQRKKKNENTRERYR